MVKVSHARCRQCGQSRHRNAKFNLCRQCWAKKKQEVVSGWHAIKTRRAERRNGAAHVQEVPIVVAQVPEEETDMPRGRPSPLTPEQEQEIVTLYTTTDQPVTEIARAYGVADTLPFRILTKNGVTWRRGDSPNRVLPPHIEAMKEVHVAGPLPPKPATTGRSIPHISEEPDEPIQTEAMREMFDKVFPPEVTNGEVTLRKWRVEFSGYREVMAESARDAIAAAEAAGALDVTLVRLA